MKCLLEKSDKPALSINSLKKYKIKIDNRRNQELDESYLRDGYTMKNRFVNHKDENTTHIYHIPYQYAKEQLYFMKEKGYLIISKEGE